MLGTSVSVAAAAAGGSGWAVGVGRGLTRTPNRIVVEDLGHHVDVDRVHLVGHLDVQHLARYSGSLHIMPRLWSWMTMVSEADGRMPE